jgi:hypothetical protein
LCTIKRCDREADRSRRQIFRASAANLLPAARVQPGSAKIGAEPISQKRRLVRNADQRVGDRDLAALDGARDDRRRL